MKTIFFVAFLAVFQLLLAAAWADDIKEADYPIHYEVLSTDRTDKLVVQKVCSMTLRDKANQNVIISVSTTRIASCHVLASKIRKRSAPHPFRQAQPRHLQHRDNGTNQERASGFVTASTKQRPPRQPIWR
jgi:hypothetical protein